MGTYVYWAVPGAIRRAPQVAATCAGGACELVASVAAPAALVVADDGVGFDPSQPVAVGHHGLGNMQKRAAAIGATLQIESIAGQGTRIIVSLPDDTDG
jgi:nitrate/nitrite-specific signal transduction histidine kinase